MDATSHDGVAMVRRLLGKVKTGHTGTLDPNATGVLPICIGKATRLAEYVTELPKVYVGEMTLGAVTSSQDFTGEFLKRSPAGHIGREQAAALIPSFCGQIQQIPPMVSAVKHQGKRLYQLAREGVEVERQPRTATIYQLDLLEFIPGEQPKITWRVVCSKGTYVRTLFHDMGQVLGCGAYLSALCRTQVGVFRLEDAYTIQQLQALVEKEDFRFLLPMTVGVSHLPKIEIPDGLVAKACHGMPLPLQGGQPGQAYQALSPAGELLGVGSFGPAGLHLDKVFV